MAMAGNNGPVALSWQEVQAFDQASGLGLTGWEKRVLRMLSQTYCGGLNSYTDPKAPPPYFPPDGLLAEHKRIQAQAKTNRQQQHNEVIRGHSNTRD